MGELLRSQHAEGRAVEWYAVLSFCVAACNPCSVKRCSGEIIPGKKGIDDGSHVVWSGDSNVGMPAFPAALAGTMFLPRGFIPRGQEVSFLMGF